MWKIIKSRTTAETGEELDTYGIAIADTVIRDISPNEQEITEFVQRLNSLGASEVHAYELVEDFLGR